MHHSRKLEGSLFAISDLHLTHRANRDLFDSLLPRRDGDCLLVCGDVSDDVADFQEALRLLAERFATVIWSPGNHELWTWPSVGESLRGVHRYMHLVGICRDLGILTPEDPYPIWEGRHGPVIVAPLFLLYDYTFGRNIAPNKDESLARAHQAGVVCADEYLLYSDPYPSREAWCAARVRETEQRLACCDPDLQLVLGSHFPLIPDVTKTMRHPEFAQWCGTLRTADWHRHFRASVVVYGHLHIPRTTWHDGVRFEEVSLGYPREWQPRSRVPRLRPILPLVT